MPYLVSSDRVSTRALYSRDDYIAHSISWGKHRYVRREGTPGKYRYIYPEDLKSAGSRLVTGAKNLASRAASTASSAYKSARMTVHNATQAAARATGVQQRQSYKRAEAERKKWADVAKSAGPGAFGKDYKGGFENLALHQQPSRYISKNLDRAYDRSRQAKKAYDKTPLGYLERAAEAAKGIPSDVKYDVESFLHSKVGLGHRHNIDVSRSIFVSADKKLKASGAIGSPEWRSAAPEYDRAYEAYRNALQDYGKTFLGSIESLLNTEYSKFMFTQPKGWGPKNRG